MMSAFLVLVVVLRDMAWAMALSSSRSLPSSTDLSSCCSAVIGLLFHRGLSPPRTSARGERIWGGESMCHEPSPDHLCRSTRDRLVPAGALRSAVGIYTH